MHHKIHGPLSKTDELNHLALSPIDEPVADVVIRDDGSLDVPTISYASHSSPESSDYEGGGAAACSAPSFLSADVSDSAHSALNEALTSNKNL